MSWRRGPKINRSRWAQVRKQVFEKSGGRCEKCGFGAGTLEADHIVSLHKNPSQDPFHLDGLQALCKNCHIVKSAGELSKGPFDPKSWAILQKSRRDWATFTAELRGELSV